MAYIKNNWVDREGTTRYFETVDDDGALIFTPDYTQVTELGTPVNADNMNHIEEGIAAGSFTKFDLNATYAKDDLVTVIEEASPVIYKSLQDNNIGNALSNSAYWEKISLGGGGLEIGDIGIAPLGIDESKGKRRYLNGQLIIQEQYVQFTNKVKSAIALYPSLVCTEAEWQTTATMTVGGQVGKFVVDDEAGTIRLPKIIMPIQGLTDLSKLAEIVEAGLPNITGGLGTTSGDSGGVKGIMNSGNAFGAFKGNTYTKKGFGDGSGTATQLVGVRLDASLSNSIYGNSNTVQQEQIQYPYFIQVATGAETEDNIINEIELNNPFSFGDSKYSPVALNNLSWLKSEGQWNSKAVYPAYYDWALINANNGVEGFKFITDEYTDYDVVINPADETFRLPLLDGSEDLVGDKSDTLSIRKTDDTYTAPANGFITVSGFTTANSAALGFYNNSIEIIAGRASSDGNIRSFLPMKKGQTVTLYAYYVTVQSARFTYAQGNGSLYFYVGETVQNANLINAGRIEEIKANKTDVDGQWIFKRVVLGSGLSFNEANDQIFDLSDYLPNDGYNYEILLTAYGRSGTANGNNIDLGAYSDLIPMSEGSSVLFCCAQTRTTNYVIGAGTTIIPIGNNRTLGIHQHSSGTCTDVGINVNAYRRIGKNV